MVVFVILPLTVFADDFLFTGGGSTDQTTDGGGSVSQTIAGGGSISQSTLGGGSVSQTIAGGGSVSQTIAGGGSISQTIGGNGYSQVYQTQPGVLYNGSQIFYAGQSSVQTPTGITYVDYPITYVNGGTNQTYGGASYIDYPVNYSGQIQSTNSNGYAMVYPTYYYQPTYYTTPTPIQNQVLSYTDTKTSPTLDSVYLSDVPYTGLADSLPMIIFILALTLWSGTLAYIFLKRKIDSQNILSTANVNTVDLENEKNDSMTSSFMCQIADDNSDINKIEEYARNNKIILSSDASAKIVKLVRLGKINASEYIRNYAKGEWRAIGEGDIY